MPRRPDRSDSSDSSASDRSPYRDGDDMRDPVAPGQRAGSKPDTKAEARGDAREAIGNTARDTDVVRSQDPTKNKVRHRRPS
jgi:hypothetical protein